MLGSRSMATLLEQPASQYDVVLIDTPALLPVTDAAILATTGGALVVAGAGLLHRQQLADGLGSLQDVGARVLGVVLNRLARQQDNTYSYKDYTPAPATGSRAVNTSARLHQFLCRCSSVLAMLTTTPQEILLLLPGRISGPGWHHRHH